MMDVLIESHIGLERQGPGSSEMTLKALSFLDTLAPDSRVADLGCGTGGQTLTLAQHIKGSIVGVDLFPAFIDVFNERARKHNLQNRVRGIVGSMENLPFEKEEFDVIWSEGAIDNIGFEKGVRCWNGFLKKGGYLAVTSPSWFTAEHVAEVDAFWRDAGSSLDSVEDNSSIMQKSGYSFIAAFALPEHCWTDAYFTPRAEAEKTLLGKYAGDKTVTEYLENTAHEVELYQKYKQHYGYAFYIGRKIS